MNSGPTLVVQRRLDFPDLKTGRPFMSVNAVMGWLDKSEDDINYLIVDGLLRYAFDISSPSATKKEIRILTESVRAYIRGDHLRAAYWIAGSAGVPAGQAEAALDEALKTLFPHSRPVVRGTEIKRAFNCSSQHILDLVIESQLQRDPTVTLLTPKSSPRIYRSSVINFLKSRRLT